MRARLLPYALIWMLARAQLCACVLALTLGVIAASSGPLYASGSEIGELEERLEAFAVAFRDADVATLEGMLAPQYVHTNGGGAPLSRDRWLGYTRSRKQELSSGRLRLSRYENQDLEIALHGSAAVVTGTNLSEGVHEGSAFSRRLRFTQVWVKADGNWQRVAFHDAEASP